MCAGRTGGTLEVTGRRPASGVRDGGAVEAAVRRTLGGRYALDSLLATGGMGQVWRGRDTLLGRPVAVKVLRSEYTGDPTFLARFRAEAQHTAALSHRNIATLYDYGEVRAGDGTGEHLAYLVMELVEGEPLSALLARERTLPVARVLELLHETAAGLAAAHAAGVVHRDVKPGNLLVGRDGVVKITDFGIAWSASDVPLTQTGQVVGTAHYLSPEQADGGKAGPASDVYALGMIAYECLAGRRAFDGENAVQIALRQLTDVPDPLPADVPDPVRSLVGRALLKDPRERYPDGAAFRDAVADVRAGRALPPLPAAGTWTTALSLRGGQPLVVARPRRRLRRTVASAVTLAIGAVLGGGVLQLVSGPAVPVTASATGTEGVAAGPATTAPDLVRVDAAAYLGRPVADVQRELTALGLVVEVASETSTTVPAGSVVSVTPDGDLTRGDDVLLTVAAAPPAPSPTAPPTAAQPAVQAPATSAAPVLPAPVPPAPVVAAPAVPAPVVRAPVAPAPAPVRAGGGGSTGGNPGKGDGKGSGKGKGGKGG
jgi:serine/threonine-protein kinase